MKSYPRLVFERLKKDEVIDDDWEWIRGRFDITTLHIEGFRLKKKTWKHFEIGVLSDRFKYEKGIRGSFELSSPKRRSAKKAIWLKYYEQTGAAP